MRKESIMKRKPNAPSSEARVTELGQAEVTLWENEKHFRTLVENLPVGVYRNTPGPKGKFLMANSAFLNMFGFGSKEELVGTNVADLYANPSERRVFSDTLLAQGHAVRVELQLKRADDSLFWGAVTARTVHDESGQVVCFDGIVEDITERKQMEETLRQRNRALTLLNRAGQALSVTLDLDRVLTMALDEVRRLLGVVASSIWLIDPESRDDASQAGELVCREATGPQSELVRGWRLAPGEGLAGWVVQNGQDLYVPDVRTDARHFKDVDEQTGLLLRSIFSVPLQVRGDVIGVLQVMDTEVDRFKPADAALVKSLAATAAIAIENARLFLLDEQRIAELTRALEQQQELDRLRSEFIQNVSHELRTPLAIARGHVELLESGALGELQPEQRESVTVIARRARMLNKIVDDITALLDAEREELVQESVNLTRLVQAILTDFRSGAEQAGLTLTTQIVPNRLQMFGNRTQLRRMLDNLLDNARKFTPGGGRIVVRLEQDGTNAVLEVTDTGIGIPSDQLERIFERFYQIDGSTTRRHGGTGLGLALVKAIVELHGGQVMVQSVLGQGSTFTVSLPLFPAGLPHRT